MNNFKEALKPVIKVAAYLLGSAVIPALLALYQDNVYWLALAPLLNLGAVFLIKWSELRKVGQ